MQYFSFLMFLNVQKLKVKVSPGTENGKFHLAFLTIHSINNVINSCYEAVTDRGRVCVCITGIVK